jgi:hypothetical protein
MVMTTRVEVDLGATDKYLFVANNECYRMQCKLLLGAINPLPVLHPQRPPLQA